MESSGGPVRPQVTVGELASCLTQNGAAAVALRRQRVNTGTSGKDIHAPVGSTPVSGRGFLPSYSSSSSTPISVSRRPSMRAKAALERPHEDARSACPVLHHGSNIKCIKRALLQLFSASRAVRSCCWVGPSRQRVCSCRMVKPAQMLARPHRLTVILDWTFRIVWTYLYYHQNCCRRSLHRCS